MESNTERRERYQRIGRECAIAYRNLRIARRRLLQQYDRVRFHAARLVGIPLADALEYWDVRDIERIMFLLQMRQYGPHEMQRYMEQQGVRFAKEAS